MSARVTLAIAGRVLTQIRRDHRTLAMLLVLPCALISLLWWMVSDSQRLSFDRLGPGLLAIFPFIVMFLVASVTTLRERSSGTLERLLSMPMGKLDYLAGYTLSFGLVAVAQSVVAVAISVGLLGLDTRGPVWLLLVVAVVDAILGTALGLAVSAFATTEFQGGAVHPGDRHTPDPPVRADRPQTRPAGSVGDHQRRPAVVLCGRRHGSPGDVHLDAAGVGRSGDRERFHARRSRAGGSDPAPTNRVVCAAWRFFEHRC